MFGKAVGSQWVGRLMWGDKVEVVLLTLEGDQAVFDRPSRFQFNLPPVDWSTDLPTVRFRTETLVFEGTVEGERVSGEVREGDTVGGFELRSVRDLSTTEFRRFIGHYRLSPNHDLMISQDARPEEHLYFYLDGDTVVRLYPLDGHTFWSERGDTLTFVEADGEVQTLRLEDVNGTTSDALRVAWDREVEGTV